MTDQTIICERCNGTGWIEELECPVCDGDPVITYKTVESYAAQIDHYRAEVMRLRAKLASVELAAEERVPF